MASNFRAVLFDLDGTLLDTLSDIGDSMNAGLARLGFPQHPIEAYRYFVGDGIEVLARRALPQEKLSDKLVAECVALMREEYAVRWAEKTRAYDGIVEMLDGLVERKLALCILTNKPQDFSEKIVAKLLPKWRFAPLVGARPNVPKKPDPSAALAIVAEMKIPAEQFLYLGDTGIDMKTAMAAGMHPVGATWGFRTADELRESGARKLIADPRELLALL